MWYALSRLGEPLWYEYFDSWLTLCLEPPVREVGREVGRLLMRHAKKTATALPEIANATKIPALLGWASAALEAAVPAVGWLAGEGGFVAIGCLSLPVAGAELGCSVLGDDVSGAALIGERVVGSLVGAPVLGATVVGSAMVGVAMLGGAVVGVAVVGATVFGAAVVGEAVVGLAVVGLAVAVVGAAVITLNT